MFHSIRWRLVASFVVVTLLTVGLIGVLALALFQRQTNSQELQFMRANADAVARQALPLIETLNPSVEFLMFTVCKPRPAIISS